jgi:triosephosphate isomerase
MSAQKSSRGVLIAGNWKMNNTVRETGQFFAEFKLKLPVELHNQDVVTLQSGKVQACIIPPALSIMKCQQLTQELPFPMTIASQNIHWENKGAFTGELSAPMLLEAGVNWTLIGHSERRQYFGETDETVRRRSETALAQGMKVILCIGETRAEREQNKTGEVLTRQLEGALPEAGKGAAAHLNGQLVLAYEPVWAIGTGLTATPAQAEEAHHLIRDLLTKRFGIDAAQKTQILYGGSVTPENIESLLACPNVDGALVGGASLKPESYLKLLKAGCAAVQ